MFRKILDRGEAGDNVGLLLRGVDKKEIKRGMVLAKPGSITPHTKLKLRFMFLRKKKVDVILHSIINIVLSSMSEHLILQVRLLFLKEQKWLCLVIMLQSLLI